MRIRTTTSFELELNKLTRKNSKLRVLIINKISVVAHNPNHPSLRLHKLSGQNYWSISINKSLRVLLLIESDRLVLYHIGTHDQVY